MAKADHERADVAFLGLGIMGSRMAANLCRAGLSVVAWNRTRERAEELAASHGASVAATPAEAASGAELSITMVVDAPQVREVLFGDQGAAGGMRPGHLAVDMSTIAPSAACSIAAELRERDVGFLDAPVTGSKPKAQDGTLTIMAGGAETDFERAEPVLRAMGRLVLHVGPQGHGSMVKLINNTVAAVNAGAVAEALTLGSAAGLDLDALTQVMGAGSGNSAMLELKAGPMRKRDFEPLFKLAHMLKDVRHCLDEAGALGLSPPLALAAERQYAEAERRGLGEQDFAAVIEAAEALGDAESVQRA